MALCHGSKNCLEHRHGVSSPHWVFTEVSLVLSSHSWILWPQMSINMRMHAAYNMHPLITRDSPYIKEASRATCSCKPLRARIKSTPTESKEHSKVVQSHHSDPAFCSRVSITHILKQIFTAPKWKDCAKQRVSIHF